MHRNVKNIILSAMTVATLTGGIVAPSLLGGSLFSPQVVNATVSNVNDDGNSGQPGTGITINNFIEQSTTADVGGSSNGKEGSTPTSWEYENGTFTVQQIKPSAGKAANDMIAPVNAAGGGSNFDLIGGTLKTGTVHDGPLVFDSLGYGYYLVKQTNAPGKSGELMTPLIVAVPMIDSDDGSNRMVSIYPKNSVLEANDENVNPIMRIVGATDGPSGKETLKCRVGLGNEITYNMVFKIPTTVGDYGMDTEGSLVVTDNLGTDKNYVDNSIVVAAGKVDSNNSWTTTTDSLIPTTDYKVSVTNNVLSVVFTEDGLAKLKSILEAGNATNIQILMNAKLTTAPASRIDNSFSVNFNLHGNTADAKVYTSGLANVSLAGADILKVGTVKSAYVDGDGLAGATFEVYYDSALSKPVKKGKQGAPAQYRDVVYGFDDWKTITGSDTTNFENYTVTTDANGKASFAGLPIDNRTNKMSGHMYYLKETKAPANFEQTNAIINLNLTTDEVTANSTYDGTGMAITGNNAKFEAVIVNHMISNFPVAGSNGYIYAIVGLVLVMGGTVIVLKKTKKEDVEG